MNKAGKTPEEQVGRPLPKPPKRTLAVHTRLSRRARPVKTKVGKAFEVVTLDEFIAMRKAKPDEGGGMAVHSPVAPAAPKKFPRRQKPTVKMKPITDEEAMANLRAGKYIEKHVAVKALTAFLMKKGYDEETSATAAKALMAGYSRTSGGGALRAPNRGYESDLERAVAMPPPSPVSQRKPMVYLPGVHAPSAKPDRGDGGDPGHKILGAPPKKKKSLKKTAISTKVAPVNAEGGVAELSAALADPALKKSSNVVHKSEGDRAMSKTNFNDLFKAELEGDEALCNCPHCEQPITKSDLEKAHGGKGKTTHLSGASKGKSSAHVRDHNPDGGVMRGGDGKGQVPSSRGVPGASKTDDVTGVQNSKGSRTHKAMDDDDSSSDDGSSASDSKKSGKPALALSKTEQDKQQGSAPLKKSVTIRGTEWVQYVDDGSDAAIAKSIAEGALGGTPPTQPLDLNNDLTRLLV